MGTRGLGGIQGLLLGSVATQVIHLAKVPITLIKRMGSVTTPASCVKVEGSPLD